MKTNYANLLQQLLREHVMFKGGHAEMMTMFGVQPMTGGAEMQGDQKTPNASIASSASKEPKEQQQPGQQIQGSDLWSAIQGMGNAGKRS